MTEGLTWIDICYALLDLVPFAQYKKREKHLWSGVTFNRVPGFRFPVILLYGRFSRV